MRVTYDPQADAAYIYLVDKIEPKGVAATHHVNELINLDFDGENHLIAIELLRGSLLPPPLAAVAEILPKPETA